MEKVLVATPTSGSVCTNYLLGSLDIVRKLDRANIRVDWFISEGVSMISKARDNMFWKWFHETDHENLLFWDSDQSFDAEDLVRLLRTPGQIKGAPVAMKHIDEAELLRWSFAMLTNHESEDPIPVQDMMAATSTYNFHGSQKIDESHLKVQKMGTGCMMVTREAAQTIYDRCQKGGVANEFRDSDTGKKCYALFQPLIADTSKGKSQYLGEDYSFCIRAQKCGIDLTLNTDIRIEHYGNYSFKGDFKAKERYKNYTEKGG